MSGTHSDEKQPALPWSRSWGAKVSCFPSTLSRYTGKRLLPSSERDSRVTSHLRAMSPPTNRAPCPLCSSLLLYLSVKSQRCTHIVCCSSCLVPESHPTLLPPHGLYNLTRLLSPWDFLGKNTGVGCHFLLQGIFPTRDQTCLYYVSCTGSRFFATSATWEAPFYVYYMILSVFRNNMNTIFFWKFTLSLCWHLENELCFVKLSWVQLLN